MWWQTICRTSLLMNPWMHFPLGIHSLMKNCFPSLLCLGMLILSIFLSRAKHHLTGVLKIRNASWLRYAIFSTMILIYLSLMVILNSCSRRIHLINIGFASFFERRYFKAAWSVKTTTREPRTYERNLSKANTTTSNSFSVVE